MVTTKKPKPLAAAIEQEQMAARGIDEDIVEAGQRAVMRKRKPVTSLFQLADELDISPTRTRQVIELLQHRGYQIDLADDDHELEAVQASQLLATKNRYDLQSGELLEVGIISDTHQSSKEHAGPELEAAYDEFERREIATVLHAGDLVAGIGIYRTQRQDIVHHTFEEQVDNSVEHYPRRTGIRTLLISGNHDLEGQFGSMGADPVKAVTNRRDDMQYLGAYAAAIELPNGGHLMLVHGRGGGGYAISYKPQRWVEGLPPGRKPGLVAFGHWHIMGWFQHRQVNLLLGGCFEWQTSLLIRLGLQPAVGFWIVRMRLADDGSLMNMATEWTQFWQGRQATHGVTLAQKEAA